MTNAFIQLSGVFAELELPIIRERVCSGMANAKAKGGAKLGRQQTTIEDIPRRVSQTLPGVPEEAIECQRVGKSMRVEPNNGL